MLLVFSFKPCAVRKVLDFNAFLTICYEKRELDIIRIFIQV